MIAAAGARWAPGGPERGAWGTKRRLRGVVDRVVGTNGGSGRLPAPSWAYASATGLGPGPYLVQRVRLLSTKGEAMDIRTVIVDDEELARRKLRGLLSAEEGVEVIAECENGREAVRCIEEGPPDLLFLDIKMPELDGFGVIDRIGADRMPATVFATAYDEYALKAFDLPAVDYLLKPFDRKRFRSAMRRVRRRLDRSEAEIGHQLEALLEEFQTQERYVDRLIVKSAGRFVFLKVEWIDWIDAMGNYVRLNAKGKKFMMRQKISALEQILDPKRFMRIHRSTIVNTAAIREIRPRKHGECLVFLANGERLTLSRSYRKSLGGLLK